MASITTSTKPFDNTVEVAEIRVRLGPRFEEDGITVIPVADRLEVQVRAKVDSDNEALVPSFNKPGSWLELKDPSEGGAITTFVDGDSADLRAILLKLYNNWAANQA